VGGKIAYVIHRYLRLPARLVFITGIILLSKQILLELWVVNLSELIIEYPITRETNFYY